jgi:uncharacterized repeat protein (TIGR02543 family)
MFKLKAYSITYNDYYGLSTNNFNTYTYGNGFSLQNPDNRDGFIFAGWYSANVGGSKVTAISNNITGDLTLWARWEETETESEGSWLTNETLIYAGAGIAFILLLTLIIVIAKKKPEKKYKK